MVVVVGVVVGEVVAVEVGVVPVHVWNPFSRNPSVIAFNESAVP